MKGQVSLEAVMAIGVAILILLSFFNLNWERSKTARDMGDAGEARMSSELLATAINTGFSNGEGFSLYLGSSKLNFSKLGSMGVNLPFVVSSAGRTITVGKNMTRGGTAPWNISVSIIPGNLARANPTSQYPEVTIRNDGTNVVIYAEASNIDVQ